MLTVVGILLTLASAAGVIAYWRMLGEDKFYGPLLPGVIVTALGVVLLVGSYAWVFEAGECSRDEFACMVNANQGVLTLLTLGIAVIAVWTSVVGAAANRKREDTEANKRTALAVRDSIEELYHNLKHVTGGYKDETLRVVPQITIDSTLALLNQEHRVRLSPRVIVSIERLRRNAEKLREHRVSFKAPNGSPATAADPEPIGGFVRWTIHLFSTFWQDHHAWSCTALQQPGLQDLPRFSRDNYLFSFRSSGAQGNAAQLRTDEESLACWFDNQPIPGVRTYVLSQRFIDAGEAHRDH